MTEADETEIGRCAFCESDENITFIVLPNSSNLVATCSRCAVVLEEARRHLEQTVTWYREREAQQLDEVRLMALVAAAMSGIGAGLWWGPGIGIMASGVMIALYAALRSVRS